MENEIWRDIPGYEGYYQASSLGRIKSLSRTIVVDGRFNRSYKERVLKERVGNRGYYLVNLWKESIQYTVQVHQLVAIAFLNHKPNGYNMIINHIDFNTLNNRVENLEIVTARENTNKKHLKSSSQYVGVSWFKNTSKWASRIDVKGNCLTLGYFEKEYDAHLAYQKALQRIENGLHPK